METISNVSFIQKQTQTPDEKIMKNCFQIIFWGLLPCEGVDYFLLIFFIRTLFIRPMKHEIFWQLNLTTQPQNPSVRLGSSQASFSSFFFSQIDCWIAKVITYAVNQNVDQEIQKMTEIRMKIRKFCQHFALESLYLRNLTNKCIRTRHRK